MKREEAQILAEYQTDADKHFRAALIAVNSFTEFEEESGSRDELERFLKSRNCVIGYLQKVRQFKAPGLDLHRIALKKS